jgi:hypothetical protein
LFCEDIGDRYLSDNRAALAETFYRVACDRYGPAGCFKAADLHRRGLGVPASPTRADELERQGQTYCPESLTGTSRSCDAIKDYYAHRGDYSAAAIWQDRSARTVAACRARQAATPPPSEAQVGAAAHYEQLSPAC